ncbi:MULTISPECIES: type VI secretion system-associated protein TagO [Hyphobacterium]|uniref:Type VI secretion system-associated protein TagO n=1 Tax=Hyphobacterium vulgare TaxID=1736751 RepID=A0ABV6ZUC8_9PROT
MSSSGTGIITLLLLLCLYLLPAIVASARRHHNAGAIFLLNLLLGWTFLGWVIALVWSATATRYYAPPAPSTASPEKTSLHHPPQESPERPHFLTHEEREQLRSLATKPATWLIAVAILIGGLVGWAIYSATPSTGQSARSNYNPETRAARSRCREAFEAASEVASAFGEAWSSEPVTVEIEEGEITCTPFVSAMGNASILRVVAAFETTEVEDAPGYLRIELEDGTLLADPRNGPTEEAAARFGELIEQREAERTAEDARREEERLARERANRGRQWQSSTWRSELNDFQNYSLSLTSAAPVYDRYGRRYDVRLILRCMENTTAMYVDAGDYLGLDTISVQMRIGDGDAFTRRAAISTDRESFGFWNGGQSIPIIRMMMAEDADRMVFRYTPYSESPQTVTFDISGLDVRIVQLREACHW